MNRTLSAVAALLLAVGVGACSSGKADEKPATQAATVQETPAADTEQKKLGDAYTDKLEAVSDGAVADCQSPSSTSCSNDLGAIMTVVGDLEADIEANGGAGEYPKTTQQIAKMRAAQQEYEDNACEGDPTADDPNSDCWGVTTATVGATTLTMTLLTDEAS